MFDQMNVFFGILVAVSLYVSINKLIRYREIRLFSKSHGCQDPPSELPYDFMGIVKLYSSTRHLLKKTALENTSYLFDKYGETYVSRILTQRVLFTCNPRNIKHVLVTRFTDFDNSTVRAHLFRPITEHGIFAVDGPEWKAARDVYRDQFAHTRSILDLSKQEEHFQIFMRRIPQAGTSFDLQPLFLSLILDLTTTFALGESSDSLSPSQSEEKKQFVDALLYIKKIMARDGFLGPVHHLLSKKDFYKDCVKVQQYVERLIDRELEKGQQQGQNSLKEQGPGGYYMLRGLTQNTRNMLELRDGLITILIAGIDSVSSLLSTTFWFLARDERVFAKLRASVLDCIGHDKPTYNQLRSLTYLRYVFNEAMRVYPPVPFNARTANTDTTIPHGGGADGNSSILIKKGQRVVFSSWGSHRSLNTFGEDAYDFYPERWESITTESMGFIPFNLGPRACPGQQYALMEASYVTVRMLQTFSQVKNRDTRPWTEKIGLNLSNENGVVIELVRDSEVEKN